MTTKWVRFIQAGTIGFGKLDGDTVHEHRGDMFTESQATGADFALASLRLLTPTVPSKVIGLWNNFKALGEKQGLEAPPEPLYFLKAPNSFLASGEDIRKPPLDARVIFEGELGIVIGKTCTAVSEPQALDHVFGYTCANDVTVPEILGRDATFAQWTRAKSFDTFCPMGPVVATSLDPATLTVKTTLEGRVRQNYPISDMRFSVQQLVSLISHDMTLHPGDVILCGTSVGVCPMKPGSLVEVEIDGIGRLSNRFV